MEELQTFSNFAAMKTKNTLLLILGAFLASVYLTACGEDRWKAYAEQTATDCWIDDTMRVWYYWKNEMPAANKVNYFQPPFTFFKNLLSKEYRFSTIDSLTSVTTRGIAYTDYSFGLQFAILQVANNDTTLYAHIQYVAQESPASEAGLKRGDFILSINGKPITRDNYPLLYGSSALSLTVGTYNAEKEEINADIKTVQLPEARSIHDNPIHYYNTFTIEDKHIGYLVYNHFSAGKELQESSSKNNNEEYNEELRKTFLHFANNQVNELILDLRYNNGGLLTCAQLLCALVAPQSAMGNTLGYIEYDQSSKVAPSPFMLDQSLIGIGANLNLTRIYILTSAQTASASEMVINCLRPYMEVVLIGEKTVGKNVGSLTFDNPEQMISITPIVCKIYNSNMQSDYSNGFQVDYAVSEYHDLKHFLPFGNPEEALLSKAFQAIQGKDAEEGISRSTDITVLYSSIGQKATNGIVINRNSK